MPLPDPATLPLWLSVTLFAAAGGVIWLTGSRLTVRLDSVAARTGLDRAFLGMLLLGGITALPEVATLISASSLGRPALAVNNLLGAAAINVLLLAIVDGFVGRSAVTGIVAQPSTMMMAATAMIVLVLIAATVTIGDVAIPGIGIGVACALISLICTLCFWMSATHDRRSPWTVDEDGDKRPDTQPTAPVTERSLPRLWLEVAGCGVLIFATGFVLSRLGDGLARQLGLTSAAVGFALMGPATALPELGTIIAALRINRPEMAFGQVLGTNFVSFALLPLGDAVYRGAPIIATLGRFEQLSALLGATLIGIFMVGLLEHRDRTVLRMGIDSVLVILVFIAGAATLIQL
ncbi:cation:H+ antiporter [Sphingomonas guangdongensis]|uniref:Cation:H+ antiporter n=1 Tax=Sphingomonas guangdongensis TaxID=1141890 RepID=A0A285R3M6_9SPHN|nr:sodium:calcium symporter [Sphingomonas guangdongensis]SOB88319.1 cation:H+ antiporter [Sphingomonas guangdongensis]